MLRIIGRFLKVTGTFLLLPLVALCLATGLVPPFLDRIYYEGPLSSHYNGERFFNPDGGEDFTVPKGRSRGGVLARWFLGAGERPEWPEHVAVKPAKPSMNVETGEVKGAMVDRKSCGEGKRVKVS